MSTEELFLDAVRKVHGQWAVHEWRAQPRILAQRVALYERADPELKASLVAAAIGMYEDVPTDPSKFCRRAP